MLSLQRLKLSVARDDTKIVLRVHGDDTCNGESEECSCEQGARLKIPPILDGAGLIAKHLT